MSCKMLVLAACAALAVGIAGPALAAGPVMPPSIPDTQENREYYELIFSETDPNWAPQGTIVADSGFRAEPNGLPYPNYGPNLDQASLFFGTPEDSVVPMDSASMMDLYGDGVCAGPVDPSGQCELTPAAEYLAMLIFSESSGGHCEGFALTTAGLFNGEIDPAAVQSPNLGLNSHLGITTQNTIARNWATQLTTPTTNLTPAQVVSELIEQLQAGQVPSIVTIHWVSPQGDPEGHAITPFAVYDRGNGVYDIGIYDNNYPFKERAIHVDTVANTWEYLVFATPGQAPNMASGDASTMSLQLQSVADSLAVNPCPVCAGGRDTNLIITAPVPVAAGGATIVQGLLDLNDEALPKDRYSVLAPLDPNTPDMADFVTLDVDPGGGYKYVIGAQDTTAAFPLSVSELSAEGHKEVRVASFPAGGTGVTVYDDDGVFGFGADVPTTPRLERSFTVGGRTYIVVTSAGSTVAAGNGRGTQLVRSQGRVLFGDDNSVGGKITVTTTLDLGSKERTYRASGAAYPAGGNLVLVYKNWKKSSQKPTLWVDKNGDGTLDKQLTMKKVR